MDIFLWIALAMVIVVGWIVLGGASSSTARYYAKFVSFGLASMVFATAPIPVMLKRPKDSDNAL